MVIVEGWVFLMGEVPLYTRSHPTWAWRSTGLGSIRTGVRGALSKLDPLFEREKDLEDEIIDTMSFGSF